jgi:hypothetical protein
LYLRDTVSCGSNSLWFKFFIIYLITISLTVLHLILVYSVRKRKQDNKKYEWISFRIVLYTLSFHPLMHTYGSPYALLFCFPRVSFIKYGQARSVKVPCRDLKSCVTSVQWSACLCPISEPFPLHTVTRIG